MNPAFATDIRKNRFFLQGKKCRQRTQSSRTTLGLWQQTQDVGYAHSRAQMSELLGQVHIDPSIRLSIELPREVHASHANQPAPSLEAQVEQLARANPGLAYLQPLLEQPNVQWQALELAQREWNYEQQGLTGAGAALVALAVAWATGGMGAGLLGTTTATATGTVTTLGGATLATTTAATATAAATATTFAAGAAINAGFTALAAQASVSLINHGGDIGKTLKDLGSQDSLKGLIASMATAGALSSLGSQLHINGKPLNQITVNDGFTAHLGKNVVNHLTRATLNSALTGASLQDSLQTALVSAAISAGAGQVAHTIGGLTHNNPALNALAHALAGCVAGAAGQGGNAGCSAGAAGAVVGELAAQWFNPEGDLSRSADTVAFASLMAAVAGALATGDGSAASVNTAATTGANAALNNYLNHTEARRRAQLRQQCQHTGTCSPQLKAELDRLDALDQKRSADLHNACSLSAGGNPGSAACRNEYALLQAARATYGHYFLTPDLRAQSNFAHMTAQDWLQLHEDVSKVVQFLNWYNPQRVPPTGSAAPTHDRLTQLPLDSQGRYSRSVVIDGRLYQPRYFPCSTAQCISLGANLDRSDPESQAFIKALDQQALRHLQTGSTVGILVTPLGAAGLVLGSTGLLASAIQVYLGESLTDTSFKILAQRGGQWFFENVLLYPKARAIQAVALIELAGGWDAFVERAKVDLTNQETSK